jgi:6,7-dimethyl-8-ribityllumazine synthase
MTRRVLIVEARFYEEIADNLAQGAIALLEQNGVAYDRLAVPGVFEVPAAIRHAIRRGAERRPRYDGYLALGCVIRGETDHYDHICREASRALMDIAVEDGVALGFGILTCPNHDLAMERASPEKKNKGAEASRACLAMMALDGVLDGLGR